MKLIDANKVQRKLLEECQNIRYFDKDRKKSQIFADGIDFALVMLDNAPTVEAIPLDKPFCKMVYGDYVCYNRNWLMKHLPMELDILQGEEEK